jgi:hypothetical protein
MSPFVTAIADAGRSAKVAALVAASFALITGATVAAANFVPPSRETRMFGQIAVTANHFERTERGALRAAGNVQLGNRLRLTGADAMIEFDGRSLLGAGTLELTQGNIALFSGGFRASAATGIARPLPGARSKLGLIGNVKPVSASVREVNMATGAARGEALVRIGPNQQVTSTLAFDLLGGLFTGRLGPVEFEVSGVTITAPDGLQLVQGGFYAPQAILTLPAEFGGGTIAVNDLRMSGQQVSIGGADGTFALPDMTLVGGVQLTDNVARLNWDPNNNSYRIDVEASAAVEGAMPGTASANATLTSVDGLAQLNGAVNNLTFNVAGGTLTMPTATISNEGIVAPVATLALPSQVGDVTFTVRDVQVGADGLSIGSGTFFMPGFTLADGSMAVTDVTAALVNVGGQYAISAEGTLTMDLPGNEQSTDVTLRLSPDGQLSGEVVGLQLNLAGATLALGPTVIDADGLRTPRATLQLPPDLGGASAEVTDIVINQEGLSFGSAGFAVNLPDMILGDGIGLNSNSAVLTVIPVSGKNYYAFRVASTLAIDWPGNEQQQQITFSILPDAQGQAQVIGTFSGLNLNVNGGVMVLEDVLLNNAGIYALNATFALPPELGGASMALNDVRLNANGLSLTSGEFALPDIVMADGSLALTGARAYLNYADGAYRLSGQGRLTVDLPDGGGATNAVAFTLSPDGSLVADSPGLALDLGGATLALNAVVADGAGVTANQASISLPQQLGSLTLLADDFNVSAGGLALGNAAVSGQVPDINLGRGTLTDNAVNVVRARTDEGEAYALVVDGTLDTGSGQRPVRVVLNTGQPIEDPNVSGLSLKLGNVNFTILER